MLPASRCGIGLAVGGWHGAVLLAHEHPLRLAALFVVGIALFAGLRWLLVPADYGLIGPYGPAP